jgi:hypothetical protein
MTRRTLLIAAAVLVLPPPTRAAEPTRAAPLYSLPEDGAWVEYDWTATGPDGKELKGSLRISSVGGKAVGDKACRWVEIRKDYMLGKEKKREYRKLLVAEKAFRDEPTLRDHVKTVIDQDGSGPPAVLSARRTREFLALGLEGADAVLTVVQDREKVDTPLGKYDTRHVSARDKTGERALEYHGWLTADVAFGCARLEMRETRGAGPTKITFTAVAARSGKGAKAEVDESKAR